MQNAVRLTVSIVLLLALTGSADAMDQSAIEETNCLAACDANQEHCMSAERVVASRSPARRQYSSLPEVKSSPRSPVLGTLRLAAPVK